MILVNIFQLTQSPMPKTPESDNCRPFSDPRPDALSRDGVTWEDRDSNEVMGWLFLPGPKLTPNPNLLRIRAYILHGVDGANAQDVDEGVSLCCGFFSGKRWHKKKRLVVETPPYYLVYLASKPFENWFFEAVVWRAVMELWKPVNKDRAQVSFDAKDPNGKESKNDVIAALRKYADSTDAGRLAEIVERIWELVDGLPPKQAAVIRHLYIDEKMSYAEIAAIEGITEVNARMLHHRALVNLKKIIAENPDWLD